MSRHAIDVGTPPSDFQSWETFEFRFHDFKNLPSVKGKKVKSSTFTCFGVQWQLWIYPGGESSSTEGNVAVFLAPISRVNASVEYFIRMKKSNGEEILRRDYSHSFIKVGIGYGTPDFATRAKVLEVLEQKSLSVEVSMLAKDKSAQYLLFAPQNPFPSSGPRMLLDDVSADVEFEVSGGEQKQHENGEETQPTYFRAHSVILRECAPTLAAMCDSSGKMHPVEITGVDPKIFKYLLHYVYGGAVPIEVLNARCRAFIDAADKYGVINLKLEAEASYVQSTIITNDNVMDNLLFADAKNCALLKEAAVDFLVENRSDVLEKVSLKDVPGSLVADILTAMTREKPTGDTDGGSDKNSFSTMRVATLRKLLHEKGLEVDGSRESMIAELKKHS